MSTPLTNFRGCMLGALLGDCVGAPFEFYSKQTITSKLVKNSQHPSILAGKKLRYTDDTAMTRCIAHSLVSQRKLDVNDIAKNFYTSYFGEPWRGYSSKIKTIFQFWKENASDKDLGTLYTPATTQACLTPHYYLSYKLQWFVYFVFQSQFDGKGSIGNGGAMRVAPLAIAGYKLPEEDFIGVLTAVTLLTHAHPQAVIGTVLLGIGIRDLMLKSPKSGIDGYADWLERLGEIGFMLEVVEGVHSPLTSWSGEDNDEDSLWRKKLKKAAERLRSYNSTTNLAEKAIDSKWVIEKLGNGVKTIDSVPTALFIAACYLAESEEAFMIDGSWRVHEACISAVCLGGDADTIASMTGALLGSRLGWSENDKVVSYLPPMEGFTTSLLSAHDLYQLTVLEDTVDVLAKPAQEILKNFPKLKAINHPVKNDKCVIY